MQPTTRSLLISALTAVATLFAANYGYGRYAKKHFVPTVTLQQAEAAGRGCIVTLGDSRMAAGIDSRALRQALNTHGVDVCIAPLAVGALPISGQAMALRRFIKDDRRPRSVVLGASTGTLLDRTDATDPSELVGNRAAELAWSEPSDLFVYYPDFPFGNLDRGVRFWFARSNALSTYASATWIKTQNLQDRITGETRQGPRNRFGSVADMNALLASFHDQAMAVLGARKDHYELSRWFRLLRTLVHDSGARLIVIEVPMISSYRSDVINSNAGKDYRIWLEGELARDGDSFLDLSSPVSVRDRDFGDGLHLNAEGAKAFSSELGEKLASLER